MKKSLSLSLLLIVSVVAMPQSATHSLKVLQSWQHTEEKGDLNKDGINDLVIIAVPPEESVATRQSDEGEEDEDFREEPQPVLSIFWGTPQGQYRHYKQYDEILPRGNNTCSYDREITITDRGSLIFSMSLWCSAGSYGTSTDTFTFRYQNGDFFLIGYETDEFSRNSGERRVFSYNYLTWRKQTVTDNGFDDSVPKKEKWEKIAKKPLKRLGSFGFDESPE
jgi:hypothetical protein